MEKKMHLPFPPCIAVTSRDLLRTSSHFCLGRTPLYFQAIFSSRPPCSRTQDKDEIQKVDEGYLQLIALETMIDFATSFTSPHNALSEALAVA